MTRPPEDASSSPPSFRVLVTGSRTWGSVGTVTGALDAVAREHGPLLVVHGAARSGADAIADRWAIASGVPVERHPAKWRVNGVLDRRAGVIRNQQMVSLGADLCLAFVRDHSRGATHCAESAARAGIPVRRWSA